MCAVVNIKLLKKIPVAMLGNLLSFLSMANGISLQQGFRSFVLREGVLYFQFPPQILFWCL